MARGGDGVYLIGSPESPQLDMVVYPVQNGADGTKPTWEGSLPVYG